MFDQVANTYDQTFTDTNIGRLLRNVVWRYIDKIIPFNNPLNILELNCGTGEDAIYFGSKGHQVLATDISEKMMDVARKKVVENGLENKVNIKKCDTREILDCELKPGYDLIFSNFGGLNCLPKEVLLQLSNDLHHLLKPNGRFIAVVMPRFCVWESLYFALKGRKKEIFRRNTNESILANVDGVSVETWYYSPNDFIEIFSNNFKKIKTKPVGFAIPPSYLEPFFVNKQCLLNFLNSCENLLGSIPVLSGCSDHFLIDLEKYSTK